MKKGIITEVICGLFVLLFVYTAISKLLSYHSFLAVLGKSPLLHTYANIIALFLPVTEIIIAGMLLIPSVRKRGLYVSFSLMLLFTGYIVYMIVFSPHLPCSCGGVIGKLTWKQHLVFNIIFTALAFAGTRLYKSNKNTDELTGEHRMQNIITMS